MLKPQLFLGLQVNESLQKQLDALPSQMREILIGDAESQLRIIKNQQNTYIGKPACENPNLESLELLEENISSHLKKIFPNLPTDRTKLTLVPIIL